MGMSASQARFLMLTARKNNVEFEGQQINQQRTTLSNESAAYYSELCNMVVPTPPSIDDYTKVSYTFDDGAMKNTITTMIARNDGRYSVNYIQQWQDDYSIVSASSSMIARTAEGEYKVGTTSLRPLGVGNGQTGTEVSIDGKTYPILDDNGTKYINKKVKVPGLVDCTPSEVNNLVYFGATDVSGLQNLDLSTTQMVSNGDGTYTFNDGTNQVILSKYTKENGQFKDGNGNPVENADESQMLIVLFSSGSTVFVKPKADGSGYQKDGLVETEQRYDLTEADLARAVVYNDPYLDSLPADQVEEVLKQEEYYKEMLNEKYANGSDEDWYVRYVKDGNTGAYNPFFYSMYDVQRAGYPPEGGFANDTINCYTIGSATKTREVIDAEAIVEKDSSGRYITLVLITKDDEGNERTTEYTLTTNTTQDDDAYNDAMNKYNYAHFQYDQRVQEINSKIEVVQQQDKALELELKHLDTEENAISVELEAVKKVISKNVESSFKTFSA